MQWKSIKWNDCQEYAILPQFWSSRKTTWLIFDPNAVLSSIDVLEKGGFVHFIFTVLLSLDACPSILQLHWHQLAISCLQFHVLFPLQFSPASHSPPAMTKKAQTLPVGQLQAHLQFCSPREENFQIHSAGPSSQSTTELLIPQQSQECPTGAWNYHCLGPWSCRHGSHTPTKLYSNQPLQLQLNFKVISKHRCRWLQARTRRFWLYVRFYLTYSLSANRSLFS